MIEIIVNTLLIIIGRGINQKFFLPLSPFPYHTLSLTNTHSLSRTYKNSLSLSHTHTLSRPLYLTHTHKLSLFLTHTHTLSLSLSPSIANGFIICFANSSEASMKNERTLSSGALPLCNNNITVPPGVIKADTNNELNRSTTRKNLVSEI